MRVDYRFDPDQDYVVVDIETTGGWASGDRITEIGAVRIRNHEVIEEWHSLINPQRSIPSHISRLTGITNDMVRDAPVFAEIVTPSATLAFGSVETVALFKEGSAEAGANRTAIIEFIVEDVDAEFARLKDKIEVVHEPKVMPWGNRTAQFRDPEGTAVSLFAPVTDAAKARFASR